MNEMLGGASFQDLQDPHIQGKLSAHLKHKGLFLHIDNHISNLLNRQ